MENKKTRKVICVQGDESKEYEQVIFVLKDRANTKKKSPAAKMDFVLEAEKIINAKLQQGKKEIQKMQKNAVLQMENGIQQIIIKKGTRLETALNVFLVSSSFLLISVLLYVMF